MIPIQNVYYMLTYAFQSLHEKQYQRLSTEIFENTADLFAEILIIAISKQIKRVLEQDYISQNDELSTIKGKIELTPSINTLMLNRKLVCTFDEYTINSNKNRIIKSTVNLLLKTTINKSRKKKLRKLMLYFRDVDLIDVHNINWNLSYNRNNQTYEMIMSICYLCINGLLQNKNEGKLKLLDLDDEHMSRLYEKFILEYYKREFPQIKVSAPYINWALDDNKTDELLPIMKTDITLQHEQEILIIDAKYYSKNTQQRYERNTVISANLYQIFAYVKNKQAEVNDLKYTTSGMLLYAKTSDELQPDSTYQMSGNKISVKTLNLDTDFTNIKEQLNNIVYEHFNINRRN